LCVLFFVFEFWQNKFCEFSISCLSCIFIAFDPTLTVKLFRRYLSWFQRCCPDAGKIALSCKKLRRELKKGLMEWTGDMQKARKDFPVKFQSWREPFLGS
jgi:hypothetical protein